MAASSLAASACCSRREPASRFIFSSNGFPSESSDRGRTREGGEHIAAARHPANGWRYPRLHAPARQGFQPRRRVGRGIAMRRREFCLALAASPFLWACSGLRVGEPSKRGLYDGGAAGAVAIGYFHEFGEGLFLFDYASGRSGRLEPAGPDRFSLLDSFDDSGTGVAEVSFREGAVRYADRLYSPVPITRQGFTVANADVRLAGEIAMASGRAPQGAIVMVYGSGPAATSRSSRSSAARTGSCRPNAMPHCSQQRRRAPRSWSFRGPTISACWPGTACAPNTPGARRSTRTTSRPSIAGSPAAFPSEARATGRPARGVSRGRGAA